MVLSSSNDALKYMVLGLFFLPLGTANAEPLCHTLCPEIPSCTEEICTQNYRGRTYLEERFTVTQPKQLGHVVEAVLNAVDRLGIDIKLAAMTFDEPQKDKLSISYGAARKRAQTYVYQYPKQSQIVLQPLQKHTWFDPSFTYTLQAFVSFLGIKMNIGPVHAYQANIEVQFRPEKDELYLEGVAKLPASQAKALTFMTKLALIDVNALIVAGLKCSEICAIEVCTENNHKLPKNALEVIECNPKVKAIGFEDFGAGVEPYYEMGLAFTSTRVNNLSP